ncbi:MAG TPA: hypothetical protein VFJ49_13110 [Methyloceanibacter sp.]|nr:hypothetical protein [Methyloceanibacter sp.]
MFTDNVSWDDFKADSISLRHRFAAQEVSELIDKVGFDDGPGS